MLLALLSGRQGTIRGVCIETPTEIARDLHHKKDSSATPFFPRILVFSMRVPDKEGKPEYRYLYFFRRHPGATLPCGTGYLCVH
jgi:hypothetical protein